MEKYEEMIQSVWAENSTSNPSEIAKAIIKKFNDGQNDKVNAHSGRSIETNKFVNAVIKKFSSKEITKKDHIAIGISLLGNIIKSEESKKQRLKDIIKVPKNSKENFKTAIGEITTNIRNAKREKSKLSMKKSNLATSIKFSNRGRNGVKTNPRSGVKSKVKPK